MWASRFDLLVEKAYSLDAEGRVGDVVEVIEEAFRATDQIPKDVFAFNNLVLGLVSRQIHRAGYGAAIAYMGVASGLVQVLDLRLRKQIEAAFRCVTHVVDAVEHWRHGEYADASACFQKHSAEKRVAAGYGGALAWCGTCNILFVIERELRELTHEDDFIGASRKLHVLSRTVNRWAKGAGLSAHSPFTKLHFAIDRVAAAFRGESFDSGPLGSIDEAFRQFAMQSMLPVKSLESVLAELSCCYVAKKMNLWKMHRIPHAIQQDFLKGLFRVRTGMRGSSLRKQALSKRATKDPVQSRGHPGNKDEWLQKSAQENYAKIWTDLGLFDDARRVKTWSGTFKGRSLAVAEAKRLSASALLIVFKHDVMRRFIFDKECVSDPKSETVCRVIEHALMQGGIAGDIHELLGVVHDDMGFREDLTKLRNLKLAKQTERDEEQAVILMGQIAALEEKYQKRAGNLRTCISREVNPFLAPLKTSIRAPSKSPKGSTAKAKYRFVPPITFFLVEY